MPSKYDFMLRGGENFRSQMIMEDTRRTWPMKSAKKNSHGITEILSHNHRAYFGLLPVLCIWYGYYLGIFVGFLTVGVGISLILLPALGLFLLLDCLVQPPDEGFCWDLL